MMSATPEQIWFCLHLPVLGLEVFTRGADRERACVLVDTHRVVARNAAAEQHQIGIGTTLATAHAICPDLTHFVRNPDRERERLGFLAEIAYRFSATVCVHEPDCLLLDVHGSLRLFGGLYRLKRDLIRLFADLGHHTVVGIAPTPLAAIAFARARYSDELSSRPSGVALKVYTARGLARLPLEHTELEVSLIERLENMGIETLGQLLRLPTAELGRRFGPALLDYLGRLRGTRPDPRRNITPAAFFIERVELLEAVTDKQGLLFPMQRLLGELDRWLIARQLGTSCLRWRFAPLHGMGTELDVQFSGSQRNRQTLLSISRLRLEQTVLPDEILSVELSSTGLTAWQPAVDALFMSGRRSRQAPEELIDRFRARLGDCACRGLRLHEDHRPEHAWRSTVARMPASSRAGDGFRAQSKAAVRRPAWLLEVPAPVERRQLYLLSGPERIETGWWDVQADVQDTPGSANCKAVHRDYYVARHRSGTHCWVFRTMSDGCWYIHGYFA
jgi:protein ImuB